jgi:hypothetical protein
VDGVGQHRGVSGGAVRWGTVTSHTRSNSRLRRVSARRAHRTRRGHEEVDLAEGWPSVRLGPRAAVTSRRVNAAHVPPGSLADRSVRLLVLLCHPRLPAPRIEHPPRCGNYGHGWETRSPAAGRRYTPPVGAGAPLVCCGNREQQPGQPAAVFFTPSTLTLRRAPVAAFARTVATTSSLTGNGTRRRGSV